MPRIISLHVISVFKLFGVACRDNFLNFVLLSWPLARFEKCTKVANLQRLYAVLTTPKLVAVTLAAKQTCFLFKPFRNSGAKLESSSSAWSSFNKIAKCVAKHLNDCSTLCLPACEGFKTIEKGWIDACAANAQTVELQSPNRDLDSFFS